jgi:molybdopterin synthase catalytic subunit
VLIRVRLFAILRERAGRDSLEIELPEGATTSDALASVAERTGLADLLERLPLAVAVNRDYARGDRRLSDGDELALIPPVSGGSVPPADGSGPRGSGGDGVPGGDRERRVHARITDEPLSVEAVTGLVHRPGAGAVVTFQGTTREVDRLDYEAYREMAAERLAAILAETVERHGLEAAAAEHRIGGVPREEASVIVATSAAHRAGAFAGAREAIDRIKAEVPIWKREVRSTAAGEKAEWVEGAPPADPVRPPATARRR